MESRTDGRWAGGADVDRTDAASELIGGDLEGPKRERGFSKDGENIGKGGGSLEEPGEGRAPGRGKSSRLGALRRAATERRQCALRLLATRHTG